MTLPRLGDLDNNGIINHIDGEIALNIAEGVITENNFTNYEVLYWANNWNDVLITADANCDGKVDTDDANLLLEVSVGNETIPEACSECNMPTATFDIN